MNRSDHNGATIEATLDDLYANEFNIELFWNGKCGFHATLGNPLIAENSFATSGAAVQWLKDQALRRFQRAKFPVQIPDNGAHAPILDDLCASHIAGSISWIWDGGFYATLGEPNLAEKWSAASAAEVLDWLRDQAIRHYPDSEFAVRYLGFGSAS